MATWSKEEVDYWKNKSMSNEWEERLKETAHAIMNADTEYDAQEILRSLLSAQRKEQEIGESVDIDQVIEKCIGIMGNKAYQGSYAAPREAFRKILRSFLVAQKKEIVEWAKKMREDVDKDIYCKIEPSFSSYKN